MISHPFKPVYDKNSKILILGSFPSVISRKNEFYYGNSNNRFWKLMSYLFDEEISDSIDDKKEFLLRNHIALWDVIESCDINGSSDSSITNVKVNDIKSIIDNTKIDIIYTNGKKASELYNKYVYPVTGIKDMCLPSTSSANAGYHFKDLVKEYEMILKVKQ
ncbi:MAG: DNA-deoxyinosine glycosylase [Erysipelotrichaceae bacterium]|nr:DNA-deoxyinosine glycosylase [Erysipelotrichaceae bacterium]